VQQHPTYEVETTGETAEHNKDWNFRQRDNKQSGAPASIIVSDIFLQKIYENAED
jgi:hypothetical protein